MKRIIVYVVLIICLTALGVIGYQNKPLERPNEKILGVTYYKYNPTTNNYDEFMIDKEKVTYTGLDYNFEECKTYTYDSKTSIVKLDCNKEVKIDENLENGIILEIEGVTNYFYNTKENSWNYAFEQKFGVNESTYKLNGEKSLSEIEIDIDELIDLISEKTTSFIYIKSNTCSTYCTIFNHEFKYFSYDNNIYYLNLDNLTQEDIDNLYEEYDTFPSTLNELIKTYPQVLVVKDGELQETLKIEIDGFDASKYENYAEKYGEDNNEDNE